MDWFERGSWLCRPGVPVLERMGVGRGASLACPPRAAAARPPSTLLPPLVLRALVEEYARAEGKKKEVASLGLRNRPASPFPPQSLFPSPEPETPLLALKKNLSFML